MKTLDEVIDIMDGIDQTCTCCAYQHDCDETECVEKTALQYLKEYREKLNILKVRMAEYNREFEQLMVEWSRIKDNPPLTWDELRTMEGKPVWIELIRDGRSAWGLSDGIYVDAFGHENVTIKVLHDLWHLDKAQLGKTWQAYRKERL